MWFHRLQKEGMSSTFRVSSLSKIKQVLFVPLCLVFAYLIVGFQQQARHIGISQRYMQGFYSRASTLRDSSYSQQAPERSTKVEAMLKERSALFHETRVDCAAFIAGNFSDLERGAKLSKQLRKNDDELWKVYMKYSIQSKNCTQFIAENGFLMHSLTEEERDFPIAFSVLAYNDIEMLTRMLAAFYRPQNYFCIHVDVKATDEYKRVVARIASCFPNILVPRNQVNVMWGHWNIIEAELICMEELYRNRKWKYFINLTGREMPLKTNFELVRMLKAYKGGNDVDGSLAVRRPHRWENPIYNATIPAGITPIMGSTHIAVNRDFVKFVLFSDAAKAVKKWLKPTLVPDESFFAVINHNPHLGVKGSYKGLADTERDFGHKQFFTRYKMWYSDPCASEDKRNGICLLSIGDLERMAKSPFMIANKFNMNKYRLVIGCLEEWLANKTLDFYMGRRTFDTSIYEESQIVTNMLPSNETVDVPEGIIYVDEVYKNRQKVEDESGSEVHRIDRGKLDALKAKRDK